MALTQRRVAMATGVVGAVTLLVAASFIALPAFARKPGCWPEHAVLRFEFASDADALDKLFNKVACGAETERLMDIANTIDVAAFIPAYTALNLLAIAFLMGGFRRPLAIVAGLAAVGALVADYIETVTLLAITGRPDGAAMLATSEPAAWIKFALLGLHGVLLAVACLRGGRRLLGVALLLPAAATVGLWLGDRDPALFTPAAWGFTLAALVAWIFLTSAALRQGLREPA